MSKDHKIVHTDRQSDLINAIFGPLIENEIFGDQIEKAKFLFQDYIAGVLVIVAVRSRVNTRFFGRHSGPKICIFAENPENMREREYSITAYDQCTDLYDRLVTMHFITKYGGDLGDDDVLDKIFANDDEAIEKAYAECFHELQNIFGKYDINIELIR